MLEIMMVLAIIAAVLGAGGMRMIDKTGTYRSQVRKLATLIRSIRNNARLDNSTCRLVINSDDEKGHSYAVECSPGSAVLMTEQQEKDRERQSSQQREKIKSTFAVNPHILKEPIRLPRGLFFGPVEKAGRDKPVDSSPAYIYFFPQGLVEEAAIHIGDRKELNWTIALNPLTGHPDLFEKDVPLKSLRTSQ